MLHHHQKVLHTMSLLNALPTIGSGRLSLTRNY